MLTIVKAKPVDMAILYLEAYIRKLEQLSKSKKEPAEELSDAEQKELINATIVYGVRYTTVPNRTVPYILSKDNTSVVTDEQPFDELNSAEDQTDTCPHRQIMELYNSVCVSLPKISKVTEARQTTLKV